MCPFPKTSCLTGTWKRIYNAIKFPFKSYSLLRNYIYLLLKKRFLLKNRKFPPMYPKLSKSSMIVRPHYFLQFQVNKRSQNIHSSLTLPKCYCKNNIPAVIYKDLAVDKISVWGQRCQMSHISCRLQDSEKLKASYLW